MTALRKTPMHSAVVLFRSSATIAGSYRLEGGHVTVEIPQEEYDHLEYEFAIEGTAEAASQYFATTNLDIEEQARWTSWQIQTVKC